MKSYSRTKDEDHQSLEDMIADHMEKGFLENIVDMFRYDRGLFPLASNLIRDERIRVRIGALALIEELRMMNVENLEDIADSLIPLLDDDSELVRGDAAYALGIVGIERHVPLMKRFMDDKNRDVRETLRDSIEEIEGRSEE